MDLGCGTGAETLDLLSRGWHMLAVDQQAEAIAHIHARLPAEHREHLTTRVASCEAVELPAADFIWASLSLSFPAPHHFPAVWSTIASALKPGGRFAGDFFGTRHAWADRPAMTVHTREQVTAHCQALSLEDFIEEAGERLTAVEGLQQWHAFSVIAKKS